MFQIPSEKSVRRMICPKCGKNCSDSSKFCDNCGTPLTANQSSQQQNSGYQNNGYQNNGYQQYGYHQGGNYRVPIKAREIAVCIILSIVTCGIYGMYRAYKAGKKIAYVKQRNTGIMDGNDSVLYLILSIVGFSIVVYALLRSELNKVATLR